MKVARQQRGREVKAETATETVFVFVAEIQFWSLLVTVVIALVVAVVVVAAISGSWENKKLLTNCVCVFVENS